MYTYNTSVECFRKVRELIRRAFIAEKLYHSGSLFITQSFKSRPGIQTPFSLVMDSLRVIQMNFIYVHELSVFRYRVILPRNNSKFTSSSEFSNFALIFHAVPKKLMQQTFTSLERLRDQRSALLR